MSDADRGFEYWWKCEEVAMHFNELAVRFRLQALGGLAVVSGVLAFARSSGAVDWRALGAGLTLLLLFWWAAAAIDAVYYGRLLRGAVKEAVSVEQQSKGMRLSTTIEEHCNNGGRARAGRFLYYMLPSVALAAAGFASFVKAEVLPEWGVAIAGGGIALASLFAGAVVFFPALCDRWFTRPRDGA